MKNTTLFEEGDVVATVDKMIVAIRIIADKCHTIEELREALKELEKSK